MIYEAKFNGARVRFATGPAGSPVPFLVREDVVAAIGGAMAGKKLPRNLFEAPLAELLRNHTDGADKARVSTVEDGNGAVLATISAYAVIEVMQAFNMIQREQPGTVLGKAAKRTEAWQVWFSSEYGRASDYLGYAFGGFLDGLGVRNADA